MKKIKKTKEVKKVKESDADEDLRYENKLKSRVARSSMSSDRNRILGN